MLTRLNLIVITLWVGALWMTGLTAYILFDTLADKQLAGSLAGKLFNIVGYIGLVSAIYLMIQRLLDYGTGTLKHSYFWAILVMFLLILASHFGVQPILAQLKIDALANNITQTVFADRFKTWHGVASVAYLLQCLLGFVLVLKARH